ncbi:class I SAM-dependent methyltransferase [Candidatus Marinarcus aquaticus]|uniref:Methyltransferase n=1 Tax=Candidatus Marinarcus aquaticus TaxID=2044504 RepID=A0A4Q0XUG8_9BACT|nr:methyltransferase domain-containing protein [Candidatus Marinarcus aquaticus]RXJ60803.1 methyltransferase [Candidatus Marinarcus aquaticus]
MRRFTTQTLYEITTTLEAQLRHLSVHETFSFEVLNPDLYVGVYSGQSVTINTEVYIYRNYHNWMNLAQALFCSMQTPVKVNETLVCLTFKKLDMNKSFHQQTVDVEQKYGDTSEFSNIHKNEESSFLLAYKHALHLAKVKQRVRILNLGINQGDEFEVILNIVKESSHIELVGIDYCQSAIQKAQTKFFQPNMHFYAHDINTLDELALGHFDLIISVGTLQSTSINFKEVFMSLIQNYLQKNGAIILGFPNCRWSDGAMIYGAKMPNYEFSDMSLLIKDIYFCKKYLQQKKYRTYLNGKEYIFLTGVK